MSENIDFAIKLIIPTVAYTVMILRVYYVLRGKVVIAEQRIKVIEKRQEKGETKHDDLVKKVDSNDKDVSTKLDEIKTGIHNVEVTLLKAIHEKG